MNIRSVSLTVCAAAFLAASCSQSADSSAPKHTLGISIPTADHGWTGGVVFWANRAKADIEAANPDVRVVISAAKDSADQVSGVENLAVQSIDALVILPSEPEPLTPVCREVAGKGVKLVVVDRGLSNADDIIDLSVVGDNPGFGRTSAEQLVKAIGGKGKIAYMEGVLCQVNTDRVEAFHKVLEGYPEVEVVASGVSDWSTEKGLKLMENFLQSNPALDAVWTGDDDVLLGALTAYEESGRKDLKILLGGGGSKAVVKKILDGDPLVTQTVTYPPRMIYVAAQEAVKLLKGEVPAEKKMVVPAEVINAENAQANYFPESAY